jgi:hydrogenase-4 component E
MNTQLAAHINSLLAALILLTAFGMLVQRRMYALLHLFAWQGFFLSVSTAIVGFVAKTHHLYISSLLTLAIKVILLP